MLPVDARLPGAVAARVARPQAEGNAAGPGRAAARGSHRGLEQPQGKPPAPLAPSMVSDPLADSQEELGPAAEEDDAACDPLSRHPRAGRRAAPGPGRLGVL